MIRLQQDKKCILHKFGTYVFYNGLIILIYRQTQTYENSTNQETHVTQAFMPSLPRDLGS